MKKLICMVFVLGLFGYVHEIKAQVTYHPKNSPTTSESELDAKINTCVETGELFPESFSLSEWTATVHYYARKTLQRLSSEHVSQIAIEKDRVSALFDLINSCEALSPAASELKAIQKIYQEEITYETSTQSTGLFEDDEIKASMDTKDAENLVKQLDKLRKKLSITRVIIRIQ